MNRKIMLLGLAALAFMAMASTASADQFHSSSEKTTLTGTQTTGSVDVFSTTAGAIECPSASYDGTSTSKTFTTIEVTPTYPDTGCKAFGLPATIHTNGCKFLFHIGAATTGTVDVVCVEGKEITITARASEDHASTVKCIVHVPAQTEKGTITYSNNAAPRTNGIHIKVELTGLKYTHTKGTGVGACPSGSGTTGTYLGTADVKGDIDGTGTLAEVWVE